MAKNFVSAKNQYSLLTNLSRDALVAKNFGIFGGLEVFGRKSRKKCGDKKKPCCAAWLKILADGGQKFSPLWTYAFYAATKKTI